MGIFKSKKLSTSKELIVEDICADVARSLMVTVDEGHLSIERSSEFWAVITSVGENTLKNVSKNPRLLQHIESIVLSENDRKAFRNRIDIPYYNTLYQALTEKSIVDGTRIIDSIRDLTNALNRLPETERNEKIFGLALPLFLHYFNEAAVTAKDTSEEFEVLALVLAIPFSSITKYLFQSKSLYTQEDWILQFDLLSFMLSQMIIRWSFLRFCVIFNAEDS